MTAARVLRAAFLAFLLFTVVAALSYTTARYAEARHPTPTTVCCPAGTTGHSDRTTP